MLGTWKGGKEGRLILTQCCNWTFIRWQRKVWVCNKSEFKAANRSRSAPRHWHTCMHWWYLPLSSCRFAAQATGWCARTGNRTYRLLCVYGKLTFYTDVIRRASTNENRTVKVIFTKGPHKEKVCWSFETIKIITSLNIVLVLDHKRLQLSLLCRGLDVCGNVVQTRSSQFHLTPKITLIANKLLN